MLDQVVTDVVGAAAKVEWMTPDRSWSAHVRLRSPAGLVSYLLTSPEWQEARFEEPHCDVLLITDGEDEDDVRSGLERLARAAVEYLSGRGRVERKRGLFGTRTTLVLHTVDGEWRIGRRSAKHPR
jgi:hypothetical protein